MKKSLMKKLLLFPEIFFGLVLVLVVVVSVFPFIPPFKNYYHSRTVLTGSMEPGIPKGSVVINQWTPDRKLEIGDVVTYQHPSGQRIVYITHRIVKIDKAGLLWRFETKGDANPAPDFDLVTQTSIEGRVIMTVPLIGYLVEFFKTPIGFMLLIALPLLIFIARETKDIWRMRRKTVVLLVFSYLVARVGFVTYASFTSGQAAMTSVTLETAAPSVQLTLSADQKYVSFVVSHLGGFKSLSYQLTYETSTTPQGVLGNTDITGDSYSSGDIVLGTCSTDGKCVYNQGVKNFQLSVSLKDQNAATTVITTSL